MKRILLFCCFVALTIFSASSYDFEAEGIFYNIITQEDGTPAAEVTCDSVKFHYYSGDIIIPSRVVYQGQELPVVRIGAGAFEVPQGALPIDESEETTDVTKGPTSVYIPGTVKVIDRAAFMRCLELMSVTLEEGLEVIGPSAFFYCIKLQHINLTKSLKVIEARAFESCHSLTGILLPENIEKIDDRAFYECRSLTEVTLSSTTEIASTAFTRSSLKKAIVHQETCQNWFAGLPLEMVILGDEVKVIEDRAFANCIYLSSITMPDSFERIGRDVFENTEWWNQHEDGVIYIGTLAYSFKGDFPDGTILEIKEGTEKIADYAFNQCTASEITLPASITDIGDGAFNYSSIKTIVIPEKIKDIPRRAFESCKQLESITFPEHLKSIGPSAFWTCSKLKRVELPSSISEMNPGCFGLCRELTTVISHIQEPMPYDHFFEGINKNATLHIPAGTRDAYIAAGWNADILNIEEFIPEAPYRPFVEEGKVWQTGWFNCSDTAIGLEYHYFDGDTIVGNTPCKKMMCRYEYAPSFQSQRLGREPRTEYVGAIYEENKCVYLAEPNTESLRLIYDFGSPVGTTINIYNVELKYTGTFLISSKQMSQDDTYHGMSTEIIFEPEDFCIFGPWREGVGFNCLQNINNYVKSGLYQNLMSCTVNDEVLYFDASLTVDPSLVDIAEVKKHWLDFTHTTKPRPKSPGKKEGPSPSPSPTLPVGAREPVGARDEADGEEMVTGEYSAKELFVNLKTLTGPYVVTLTDDNGKEVYRKEVQTSNIVALNTNLTKYADGTYTLVVENSEEQYTATLALPLIDDAVRDLPTTLNSKPSTHNFWYDLSGHRLNSLPTQKGIYIRDGKKVVVK